MDTEDEIQKPNKKAFLFLLVIAAFGFFCFKFASSHTIDFAKINTTIVSATTSATCASNIVDQSTDTSKSTAFVNIDDSGTAKDVTPQVLGTESINSCTTQNLYTSGATCATSSTNKVTVNGKTFLASQVTIQLDKIVAPIVLLSGSSNTEISNSNRNDPGIYKPAGEQYSNKQVLVNSAPGELHDSVESQINSAATKKNYGTQYSVTTSATSSTSVSSGDVVINKYVSSDCKECGNISNANPDKSNLESQYLDNVKYRYPTKDFSTTNEGNTITIMNQCEKYKDASFFSINTLACINIKNIFWGSLISLFPNYDWNKCDPETNTDCVSAENLVVKMSPLFENTNTYMLYRNLTNMDATTASNYTPVYVFTSCRALITDKETGSVLEVPVKCAWDLSYLFLENEASKYDDIPGSKATPSTDAFIKYLQQETVLRDVEPLISM